MDSRWDAKLRLQCGAVLGTCGDDGRLDTPDHDVMALYSTLWNLFCDTGTYTWRQLPNYDSRNGLGLPRCDGLSGIFVHKKKIGLDFHTDFGIMTCFFTQKVGNTWHGNALCTLVETT